jgi:hypothetical protein
MLKFITDTMLISTMGCAWSLITTGERIVAAAERWEVHAANELHAGFVELSVWRTGTAIVGIGERLEHGVNRLALRLGFADGAVSGMLVSEQMAQAR